MPAFEFLSYDELLIVAFAGLFLVLRNWWDWLRDAIPPPALPATIRVRPIAARAAAALRRLRHRAVPRIPRPGHQPGHPGHRPTHPGHA